MGVYSAFFFCLLQKRRGGSFSYCTEPVTYSPLIVSLFPFPHFGFSVLESMLTQYAPYPLSTLHACQYPPAQQWGTRIPPGTAGDCIFSNLLHSFSPSHALPTSLWLSYLCIKIIIFIDAASNSGNPLDPTVFH